MNPFERFEIDHLSARHLNLWRTHPGIWAQEYIAKVKDDHWLAKKWRGIAVENGMAAVLRGKYLDEAKQIALANYDLNAAEASPTVEELDEQRKLIQPMLATAYYWKAPGELLARGQRIEYFIDPIPIPIIGFCDFSFAGIDVDLKTTERCPSKPRDDHVRQVSLYRVAREREGALLYVTGKRRAYFEITDEMAFEALESMRADAIKLYNFLATMPNRERILQILPFDPEHYLAGGRQPKTTVPLIDVLSA